MVARCDASLAGRPVAEEAIWLEDRGRGGGEPGAEVEGGG